MTGRAVTRRGRHTGLTRWLVLLIFAIPDREFTRGETIGSGGRYACKHGEACGQTIPESQYLEEKEDGWHTKCRNHRLPMTKRIG